MAPRGARGKPFRACRKCKSLIPKNTVRCPVCGSTDISDDWDGIVIVIDVEKSEIAKKLEITKPGRYAIKVR